MLRKLTDLMRGLKIISDGINKLVDVREFWKYSWVARADVVLRLTESESDSCLTSALHLSPLASYQLEKVRSPRGSRTIPMEKSLLTSRRRVFSESMTISWGGQFGALGLITYG